MIALSFGMWGNIADVITVTHAKFYDSQFRGFVVLIPPILPFFIGLAGRPYLSLSHCRAAQAYTVICAFLSVKHLKSKYKGTDNFNL